MHEDQTQNVSRVSSLARRIKFLRGELSQNDFAKKIGVSRSALANYETGRTIPSSDVLTAISNALDISNAFLESGKVVESDRLLHLVGLSGDLSQVLTQDEWSIIRALRACNASLVREAVHIISEGYFDNKATAGKADPLGFADDLMRLMRIVGSGGQYAKGPSQDNKGDRMCALTRRLSELRSKDEEGPQSGPQSQVE